MLLITEEEIGTNKYIQSGYYWLFHSILAIISDI